MRASISSPVDEISLVAGSRCHVGTILCKILDPRDVLPTVGR